MKTVTCYNNENKIQNMELGKITFAYSLVISSKSLRLFVCSSVFFHF